MLESSNKDGFKMSELNVKEMVKKLHETDQIEIEDAKNKGVKAYKFQAIKKLWGYLGDNFGDEYFLDLIEEQFGISDESNNQNERLIKEYIEKSQIKHDQRIKDLTNLFQQEIKILKQQV